MTPTAIGAIFHLIPTGRPFFAPGKGTLTGETGFCRSVGFFALFSHRETLGDLIVNPIIFRTH